MMKGSSFWRRTASAAITLATCISFASVGASAVETAPVVSYGVNVLAAQTDMAVAGFVGNEVVFDAEDFKRNLNLSHVEYITVCSLPAETEGELLLGSTRVAVGQSIAAANLSHLCFVAASEDVTQASFTFSANGSASPLVCNIRFLQVPNATPTLSMASDLSLNVSTYRDLCAYGTLAGYDPDGDEMVFEIVSYPQNGSVRITDRSLGTYVYTPDESYTGYDRFSYVARDVYGNYSAAKTVTLRVSARGTQVTYVDMKHSKAEGAALTLTAAGIMSGTQIGNQHYFHPEKTVSRVDFLVMAMNAAGISDVPKCEATAFCDDENIPASMKGYVDTAYSLGYISGKNVAGELCFLPNEEITRAEAAVIVDAILGLTEQNDLAVIPTFSDGTEIPVWAKESIYSLHTAGIMLPTDGYISAKETITREESAAILAAVMAYQE